MMTTQERAEQKAAAALGCSIEVLQLVDSQPGGTTYADGERDWSYIYTANGQEVEIYYDHAFDTVEVV